MSTFSRWKKQLIRSKVLSGLSRYPAYFRDWVRYRQMNGAETIRLKDTYPCLFDKTAKTKIDSHYFYQHIWAMEKILVARPAFHVRYRFCRWKFVSERLDKTRTCMDRLGRIGPYEYNYHLGETGELALSQWVTEEEMKKKLNDFADSLAEGDLYARLIGETTKVRN